MIHRNSCRISEVVCPHSFRSAVKLSCTKLVIWCVLVLLAGAQTPASAAAKDEEPSLNLFRMPEYAVQQANLARRLGPLFRQGKFAEAEKALRNILASHPYWPVHHYMLGAALAHQGKIEGAFESLESAKTLGFSNAAMLQRDSSFLLLRGHQRFRELLAEIADPNRPVPDAFQKNKIPGKVSGGRALVESSNTVWDPRNNLLLSAFQFPNSEKPETVYTGSNPELKLLNQLYKEGKSAGNYGDLYDNRDNDHSSLSQKTFQQLTHVEYSKPAKAVRRHYGLNSNQMFNAITIGNSSTAVTGQYWRSQARLMLSSPTLAAHAYRQYANNQLYVYPEHQDHDPERGDLFPVNTPYLLISQGSSGSDQPFLQALAAILAALPPDVKPWLRQRRLVAPTLQWIFRKGLKTVRSTGDYLSARAHPTVFDANEIDLGRMIEFASNLRSDVVPPSVQLRVQSESTPTPGLNYFGPSRRDEVLFNTPSAIARIHRSTTQERVMIVSAEATQDPNGRALKYSWKLLRGDPDKVSITPLGNSGAKAEIRIKWHAQNLVPFRGELRTHRVDIGVFAHNGVNYSSPAFVTVYNAPNQFRRYDDEGRVMQITYDAALLSDRYVDPTLFASRNWQDHYSYTEQNELIGWQRKSDEGTQTFTRHGARAVAFDGAGRPIRAELITYRRTSIANAKGIVQMVPQNRFVHYRYRDASDRLGVATFCGQPICNHH